MKRLFLAEILKFTLFFAIILSLVLWLILSVEINASTKKLASQVVANSIEKVKYDTLQYEILRREFHSSNISKAKTVSYIIAEDPSVINDLDRLNKIKEVLDVDEIYISNEEGIGIWGTAYYGPMDFNSHEQMRVFIPALTDKQFILSQEPMPRAADGLIYQYTGTARLDKPGIVQVGMAPQRMEFFLQIGYLSKISDISPILDNGFVAIIDRATGKIISFKNENFIGQNISEIGLPLEFINQDGNWGRATVNNVDSFVFSKLHEKYAYLALIPFSNANEGKAFNIFLALIFMAIVLGSMVVLVMFMLNKHILTGINYIINSMTEITKGSLDKRVDLATCGEFKVLSGSINDTVDSLKRLIDNEKNLVRETERLASVKSQFLARMSHEIRTPINVITGMAKVGADNPTDTSKILEVFNDINVASRHLMSVINDILDMSKIEAGKLEIVNEAFCLSSNIKDITLMMKQKGNEQGLKFSVFMEDIEGLVIISDKLRLNQVLLNLLSNAMKFTMKGGNVELFVKRISGNEGKAYIAFSVKDSGIGMTTEEMDLLFVPFQQADGSITRKFGGTGLGLSISRSIIELMGGNVGLSSEKGKGSEFSFTLAFEISDKADDESSNGADDTNCNFIGVKVLLVDDVPLNRKVVCALLERSGIEIDEASNGGSAISMFEAAPENYYDMILMDIHMPDIDGYTATGLIRISSMPDAESIPIIAVTADAFKETLDKVVMSGMNDYISKPIDFKKLCAAINKYRRKE